MVKLLTYVRHGSTVSNQVGRTQGQSEDRLSDIGLSQSHAVGKWLAGVTPAIKLLLTSDLPRCKETSEIIRTYMPVPMVVAPVLRERDLGTMSGVTKDELRRAVKKSHLSPCSYRPPGGETHEEVRDRAIGALDLAIRQQAQHVAIVTHGGILRQTAGFAMKLTILAALDFLSTNGAISRFRSGPPVNDEGVSSGIVLDDWDSVEHLPENIRTPGAKGI